MKSIKVPKPRQFPSGSWFVRVTVDGQRYPITEATEELCVARAMAIKQELLTPVDRTAKPTLSKCIDRYIEARSNVLSSSTINGYRVIQRNRFQSAMNRPITAFDVSGWQRLVNLEAKIVSAKTLQNAWFLVSSVIHEETGMRYNIKLPQIISNERSFLDPEQINIFVQAVHGTKYEIPALLALCSLRRSELLALTWDCVDFEQRTISVRGAIVYNEQGRMAYKRENKTRSSRRVVPIMIPALYDALSAARLPSGLIVTSSASALYKGINAICRANNLPEVGFHGLRHSFASLAYHLNMPEKIAMMIGGWDDDATMRKIYTHVSKTDVLHYQNAMASYYSQRKDGNENGNGIL